MTSSMYKPGIASLSLGRAAQHSLRPKLEAAAKAGFTGIEVFYEDLDVYANSLPFNRDWKYANHELAAEDFRQICDQNNLSIICLQPFMHYEGVLDESEREKREQKLHLWFILARILGTDIIQVPSNFLPANEITGDRETIVQHLQGLAEEGARQNPPVKFAYENVCWGTHIWKWKQLWEIVKTVDRDNFGMCLDVSHLCGGEWADPASDSGTVGEDADAVFAESMKEMARTVDVKKIFYIQVADAEQAVPAMREGAGNKWWVAGQPSRMTWSRNMRVFAFEETGYLPVDVALKALLDEQPDGLGYKGWVSMEVFSWTLAEKDENVPERHAERGRRSWDEIRSRLKLNEAE